LSVCRWGNFSFSQANQNAVLSAFPDGLVDANELEAAIQNGTVSLHGASESEISEHTDALIKLHNKKWAAKSISQLKAESGLERTEREQMFNRVTPVPTAPAGTTPLPAVITKEKIQAALNNGDRQTIHIWATRYGGVDAINSRLQGLN
jgi:hypothetical protein